MGVFAPVGAFIMVWCAAVLATGAHLRTRDNVFAAVYYGGLVALLVLAATRACRRGRQNAGIPARSPFSFQVRMMTHPPPSDDDPLADFELPPEIMSQTFEHAISDDAGVAHERGHAVAAALQKLLPGSTVEFGFPGIVTAHLRSGAVARCGGPTLGWMIDVQRRPGGDTEVVDVAVDDEETDVQSIAGALAKKLKRR